MVLQGAVLNMVWDSDMSRSGESVVNPDGVKLVVSCLAVLTLIKRRLL